MANLAGLMGKCGRCVYEMVKEAARLKNEKVVLRRSRKGYIILVLDRYEVMPPYGEVTNSWLTQHNVLHVDDITEKCMCGYGFRAANSGPSQVEADKVREAIKSILG